MRQRVKVTSYKLSKDLQRQEFYAPTTFYWIKTKGKTRAKLTYMEGDFYTLSTSKVYPAYALGTLLNIFDTEGFELQEAQFAAHKQLTLRLPRETLVDLVARGLLKIIEDTKKNFSLKH